MRPLDKLAPLHGDSFSNVPYMYIFLTIYITFISADAVFDVDSDSDLRLELGARLGLAFGETRAFACFWVRFTLEMHKRLHFRSAVTGDYGR